MLRSKFFKESGNEENLIKKLDNFLSTISKKQIVSITHTVSTLGRNTRQNVQTLLTVLVIYKPKQ